MSNAVPSSEHDFGRLFVQHQRQIYGFIRSLVVRRTDADDVLQETASVLWQKFDKFQPGSNFLAWALEVARYQVLYFRQRRRHDAIPFSEAFLDTLAADTVAESARLGDLEELLDKCMEKLPPPDRDLFHSHYHSGLSTKRLAEQLGRPLSTVYDAVRRIRRALAECVGRSLAREARK